MDMSAAAKPAHYGNASRQDEKHPLFKLYQRHRMNMSKLMVDCEDFKDWLYQHEAQLTRDSAAKHTKYPAFMDWMKEFKGGARKCPVGTFPNNFFYWLEGGRW